jgi:chaperonin cofactor prefoldin
MPVGDASPKLLGSKNPIDSDHGIYRVRGSFLCAGRAILPHMKETDFEEGFDRIEKHFETVAKQIDVLARATEREFSDLHHSINHRFERVSARLETIEARIEVFSRHMDDEVEQRHKLAERVSNLERSV